MQLTTPLRNRAKAKKVTSFYFVNGTTVRTTSEVVCGTKEAILLTASGNSINGKQSNAIIHVCFGREHHTLKLY